MRVCAGELVTVRAHYYEALNSSPFADESEWLGWRRKLAVRALPVLRNTQGYSSTYLAMGFADVRAGTSVARRGVYGHPPEH